MSQLGLKAITVGDHVLCIYRNSKEELADCFEFLKAGFDNNEAVMIMTDDMTKDDIRHKIAKEWRIDSVSELEEDGTVIITTNREWYYPDGKVDAYRVQQKWRDTSENIAAKGKKGLRAFVSIAGFFKDGLQDALVEYESNLGDHFDIPFTAICSYRTHMIESLSARQFSSLYVGHGIKLAAGFNLLKSPLQNQRISLLYSDEAELERAISAFINEGLERDQLCVYATIHANDKDHIAKISSLVRDYDNNIAKGDLIIFNAAPAYVSAMVENYSPFENLLKQVTEAIVERTANGEEEGGERQQQQHVRIVSDCENLLFRNQHFDECRRLVKWWRDQLRQQQQQQSFAVSYMSPYSNELLQKFPYDYHKHRIFVNYDAISDAAGNVISTYVQRYDDRSSHRPAQRKT